MQAVTIDLNGPSDILFKYELNLPEQCVTVDSEIREASKHLKENKKRKENRCNINLYSFIIIIVIIVIIVFIIVVIAIIIVFRFEVNFSL